jgi:His/Glu/Gln/Arg/opine family amino acid ABC transporter permease subunit
MTNETALTQHDDTSGDRAAPPDDPMTPAGKWVRENLFSSVGNGVQTAVFGALVLLLVRWLLGMVFAEEANWRSVGTNMRLLMTYNYPLEQYVRIWVTVGSVAVAAGCSLAAWKVAPSVTFRRLGVGCLGTGIALCLFGVVTPASTPTRYRVGMFVVGAVFLAAGLVLTKVVSEPHRRRIPFAAILLGVCGAVLAFVWLYPLGRYESLGGEISSASGTINETSKTPWTITILLLVAAWALGRKVGQLLGTTRPLRLAMAVWWVVGPAFLIFLVLRDPAFDWGYIARVDLPLAAAFGVGGAVLLHLLSAPGRDGLARIAGVLVGAVATFNWVAAFFGWYSMLQKVRFSFVLLALFLLIAPTFAGERRQRLRFAGVWLGTIVILHWLITGINTPSTLTITAPPFLGGFLLSCVLAYYVMLCSFPLGVLLALARTSKMPIFRLLSTSYIEVIRGIPLITILFFFSIMLPLFLPGNMDVSELAAIFIGYTLFSAAYMAENIRGGLQSIRRGQYEAADALGLTTVQRTAFIVLPQALRVSIPNLVGQAIATFKETSLIYIVGGFDLLRIANVTISNQPDFLGQKRPALLFVCVVYWVFAYGMSRTSRNLEQRLGVGQGR